MSAAAHLGCDAAPPAGQDPERKVSHPRLVLATTILASSLAFIDGSVVNVGLPTIGRSFHAAAGDLQWVVNAYLLPLSALLLLGGAAGDRFGRRRLLVTGTALFALASAACALAPSLAWLLLGRGLQGVGAALLMPNSLAILGGTFSGEARGRAIGTWAAMGAVTGAVGPVIGGWLIDTVGWRFIFLLNLPLSLGAIGLALAYVRDPPAGAERAHLDWLGAALATAGLGAATWALTVGSGPAGWTAPAALVLGAGLGCLAIFLAVERRLGERAMMPLGLFASSTFVGLTVLTLLLYGALGGLLVTVPYVLIRALDYSGVAAGASLLPLPLVIALSSRLMGGLAGRIGSRIPLTAGPLVVAVGFLRLLRVGGQGRYWTTVLPAILVIAIGMAGAVAPLTTAVLGSVDTHHQGSASGLNSAVARTGGLVATALLGVVIAARGAELVGAFHVAVIVGALAALGAAAAAALLIRNSPPRAAA